MLHARTARALSKTRDRRACAHELDAARDQYSAGTHDDDPEWIYWMTAREIELLSASCALELDDPGRALQHFAEAHRAEPGSEFSSAKDDIIWLAREAKTHLALGDVDAACEVASSAYQDNTLINSARSSDELADFRVSLKPHRHARAAREYLSLA